MRAAILLLVVFAWTACARAACPPLWVDQGPLGNDTNNGQSAGSPVRTFQRAMQLLGTCSGGAQGNPSVLYVVEGTYSDLVTVSVDNVLLHGWKRSGTWVRCPLRPPISQPGAPREPRWRPSSCDYDALSSVKLEHIKVDENVGMLHLDTLTVMKLESTRRLELWTNNTGLANVYTNNGTLHLYDSYIDPMLSSPSATAQFQLDGVTMVDMQWVQVNNWRLSASEHTTSFTVAHSWIFNSYTYLGYNSNVGNKNMQAMFEDTFIGLTTLSQQQLFALGSFLRATQLQTLSFRTCTFGPAQYMSSLVDTLVLRDITVNNVVAQTMGDYFWDFEHKDPTTPMNVDVQNFVFNNNVHVPYSYLTMRRIFLHLQTDGGGLRGTMVDMQARDVVSHLTVFNILNTQTPPRSATPLSIVRLSGVNVNSTLMTLVRPQPGLTLVNTSARFGSDVQMVINGPESDVVMENPDFESNTALFAAAFFSSARKLTIRNGRFVFNRVKELNYRDSYTLHNEVEEVAYWWDTSMADIRLVPGSGGAIVVRPSQYSSLTVPVTLEIDGLEAYNNRATLGGAIYMGYASSPSTHLKIRNAEFNGNYASLGGGALACDDRLHKPDAPSIVDVDKSVVVIGNLAGARGDVFYNVYDACEVRGETPWPTSNLCGYTELSSLSLVWDKLQRTCNVAPYDPTPVVLWLASNIVAALSLLSLVVSLVLLLSHTMNADLQTTQQRVSNFDFRTDIAQQDRQNPSSLYKRAKHWSGGVSSCLLLVFFIAAAIVFAFEAQAPESASVTMSQQSTLSQLARSQTDRKTYGISFGLGIVGVTCTQLQSSVKVTRTLAFAPPQNAGPHAKDKTMGTKMEDVVARNRNGTGKTNACAVTWTDEYGIVSAQTLDVATYTVSFTRTQDCQPAMTLLMQADPILLGQEMQVDPATPSAESLSARKYFANSLLCADNVGGQNNVLMQYHEMEFGNNAKYPVRGNTLSLQPLNNDGGHYDSLQLHFSMNPLQEQLKVTPQSALNVIVRTVSVAGSLLAGHPVLRTLIRRYSAKLSRAQDMRTGTLLHLILGFIVGAAAPVLSHIFVTTGVSIASQTAMLWMGMQFGLSAVLVAAGVLLIYQLQWEQVNLPAASDTTYLGITNWLYINSIIILFSVAVAVILAAVLWWRTRAQTHSVVGSTKRLLGDPQTDERL